MKLNFRRLLAMFLSIVMVAGMLPAAVFAEDAVVETQSETYVAYIGEQGYETLAKAVAAVKDNETITISGEISEGTIKLPTTLNNVTIKGGTLKDMTITAPDGNSFSYVGLTFDGITFENSRLLFTGWRNGDEVIENFTVTNCTFKNLNDSTNNAPVHINKDASEPVNGFTFTNNVIDGATGGSKSGIYLQATGNVTITGNVINNVSFRPFVVQLTSDDGIADTFTVEGNTFSGSAAGRAQGLSNNAEGTDSVYLVVTNNIFKDIKNSQQICYWNFNAETTTANISKNYYDIDIENNPSGIYYNKSAASVEDLVDMGVFPIYKELNADGTINTESAYTPATPAVVAQVNGTDYAILADAVAAVKANGGTLTLLADAYESMTFNYPADGAPVEITIDLNGFTITSEESTLWVSDGYVVTVMDSSAAKTGKILSTSETDEAIAINRDGKVILESGYVSAPVYSIFLYSGNTEDNEVFVMNGGEVYHQNGNWFAIGVKSGKATIRDGKVTGDKIPNGAGYSIYVYEGAALEITGGTFRGTIGNFGDTSISGGTFSYCEDPNDGFNNSHLASGYTTKKNADGSLTVYALPTSLQGSGTEDDPYLINNIDDLKFFRDSVNNGTRYNGQFVKLNADIDLNDEEWTPIGDRNVDQGSFLGTFDGGNHTISNLWISKWNKTGAGFFSKVGMQTEYVSGTVKNLTFENVTIISSQDYVGVIAQAPSGALIDNVHVTGDISISGHGYVGGIVGHGYPTINNSSVIGDGNGTITANYWGAGAILGFAGDHGAKINNATVEGVKIHANYGGAASVAGSPYGAAIDGANVKDVVITSNSDYCMGYVSAGGSVANVTATNVTATANGQPITPADVVASVDGTMYFDLQSAINKAQTGNQIKVLRSVTTDELTIPDGATVVLDLNGKTLNGYIAPCKPASLTISNGSIKNTNPDKSAIEINAGKLTLTDVNIESARHGVRIDGVVKALINGGQYTLTSTSGTRHAVNVSGAAEVTISDGTFVGPKGTAADSGSAVCVQAGATVSIEGGSYFGGKNNTLAAAGTLTVTGGTFDQDPSTYVATGYKAEENEGTFSVVKSNTIWKVATKAELADAVDKAQAGDTILLTADIDYGTDQLKLEKAITLDLGGKTLTTRATNYGLALKNDGCVVTNGTLNHAGTVAAIKVWNAKAITALEINVTGTSSKGNTIDGIVIQENAAGVDLIQDVTIHSTTGQGVDSGIKTYNCGNATEPVIGSMENVTIDAKSVGLNISAPCGTATNCTIKGGTNGIEIWIKGTYSATLDLYDCEVVGGVFAHDEFSSNPSIVNNGTLKLTADTATTGVAEEDITLTIARAENVKGILKDVMDNAQAKVNDTYYATLAEAVAEIGSGDVVINLLANATLDITAWQNLAIGGDTTTSITINGNGKTLTFNHLDSDWNNVATNNNAKLILNDMTITNSGYNNGPWNRHDINFACNVELNSVNSDKALAFKAGAVLDNVTISDANTSDTYAIWIQPNGQMVTITNSTINMLECSDGRGIKIDNQYVDAAAEEKVTLNVSNTSFKTEEKAAILVKSTKGADITLDNVDINGVVADTANAVWNDEDSADYLSLITVNGGTVYQEGAKAGVAKIGEEKFETVAAALTYAKEQGMTDVEITLIGETKPNTTDSFNLVYTPLFDSVTFKQEDPTKTYYLLDLYTGVRTNGGKFIFDGVNIIVTEQYIFEGNVELINNSKITSKAEANCFFYYANVIVNGGSSIKGVIEAIRGGTLTIDGGKTDGTYAETPGLQDAILAVDWADSKLVLQNGAYVKINSANEVGRLTVNGTLNISDSKLDSYQWIAVNAGATLTVDDNSTITTKEITGAGKLVIDATGMTAGAVATIDANASGFTGTLEVINNEKLTAEIDDNGNIVLVAVKTYVAQIGENKYTTLTEAVAAANAVEGGATVELLADVTLGEKLTISGNVTISGAHTITRDAAYTGTLFEVAAGAVLTLDDDLTIDGGNAWNYTKTPLEMDMANGAGTYVANHITPAEGGVNAIASLIVNKGTLNANNVTIENCYSTNGVSVIDCGASSVTTLNGALMQNIAANRSGAVLYVGGADAVLTIKGGTRITGNFGIGNGGIIQNYGQGTTVNMEGGSIDHNHIGKSGTLYATYSGNADKINTFNMSGGIITENIMEGYGPIYIHTNSIWNMTGGEISNNISFLPSYVRNNNPAGSMTGGKIINNEITGLEYSNGYYVTHPDLRLNGKTEITGGTFTQDVTEYLAPGFRMEKNADGTYGVAVDPAYGMVAKIGDTYFATLAEALNAAADGATIELIWAEGDAPIAMNGYVSGKTVTITGTAQVDWEKGFLFVGRTNDGTAAADATLIFENATLTTTQGGDHGIHVSGAEKGKTDKANGTVKMINSTINLSYLINKGTMTLDKSTLTVKNGFSVGGRPASETESGEDATATISLNNGSKVVVNNHNGMGLGYEAIGVMNIDATSAFETTQNFLVTAKGTMNLAGTAKVAGTLTNNGSIVLTDAAATLTSSECGKVSTDVEGYEVKYADGKYALAKVEAPVLSGSIRIKNVTLNLLDKVCIIYKATDDNVATNDTNVVERGILLFDSAEKAASKDIAQAYEMVILEWDENEAKYIGQTEGIDARDMDKSQFAVAYVKMTDGTYIFGTKEGTEQILEYSPLIYCKNMQNSDVVGDLCAAMMHYGAAAQVLQYGKTTGLMNEGFAAVAYDATVLGETVYSANGDPVSGMKLKAVTMDLQGAISYIAKYVADDSLEGKKLYAEYTLLGKTGSVELVEGNDGRLWAVINGVAPKDLGATLTVKPYYLNENGQKVYGGELVYSGYEYVRRTLNNTNSSKALKDLCEALAMFIYYADNFGNN